MAITRTFSLADLFELVAGALPGRVAIICGARRSTYGELEERASRLASHLQRHGVGAGDTVGLQLHNGPEYLEGFFAACKLRAIPLNVNYRYVAGELRYLYDNAGLAALLYSQPLAGVVEPLLPEFPGIRVALQAGAPYESALAAASPAYAVPQRSDDDLSLLYTGGTTGMPKGTMWPHRSLFFGALGGGGFYRREGPVRTPEEIVDAARGSHPLRFMPLSPLMHGAALWATLVSVFAGQTVVLRDEVAFDAEKIWDTVVREGVNSISIVGDAMAVPLLDALEAHPGRWDLSRLVHIGSGGGLFSTHVQQKLKGFLPNVTILDSMSSSESGLSGSGSKPQSGAGFIRIPPRADLRVLAHDRSRFVGPGEEGILVRSGHLAIGYWRDPKKSAETFVTIDGLRYVVTGDIVKVEPDGSLTVLGRGSQCINTGGEKVFPEEVEEILRRHEGVADALVVGVPDPRWGNRVAAVVRLRPGRHADAASLQAHCREHIAGYKVPKSIAFVDEMKRSPAGKADYRWARDTVLAGDSA
ncbi:MAG: AMP-binding protein [Gammaproteobacteria bacterium]|nr:AMP-binding protein [Gammaproteobacteria bacterium]